MTEKILLGTGIGLPAQHDPITFAKELATLDQLTGGRVEHHRSPALGMEHDVVVEGGGVLVEHLERRGQRRERQQHEREADAGEDGDRFNLSARLSAVPVEGDG